VYPFIDSPAKIRINPRTRDTAGKKKRRRATPHDTPPHRQPARYQAIDRRNGINAGIASEHRIRAWHSGMAFGHGTKKAAHHIKVRGSHYHAEIIPTVSAPRTIRIGRLCTRPEQNAGIISAVLYAPAD
jgi:hypothetical protein